VFRKKRGERLEIFLLIIGDICVYRKIKPPLFGKSFAYDISLPKERGRG
jgi:hypothetical protein